ncbi:hypothetical protein E4Z66_03170 [Aliishimia ponticola]|uniref:DUF1579 domain-containing protein n=1 Tax=Aliishimia ponticola TaxID=2499833 RepID=A0A4S4NG22_9RHOB|nr:hypothetical protein [Aliishimia ponticola]THH38586.1 hypothetical protein E4Z66_03170 [Aliishimia ponticola]
MTRKALSLSGEWTGVFDYANTPDEAVTFTASLTDVAGVIWGTTCERNSFSPIAARDLSASLSGMRSGYEVRFRKEYMGDVPGGEDIISYVGHVSEDGNRISGDWRIAIPGVNVSGPFVMNRVRGTRAQIRVTTSVSALIERG